jgi:hypothetical protein
LALCSIFNLLVTHFLTNCESFNDAVDNWLFSHANMKAYV